MISVTQRGDFVKTDNFLEKARRIFLEIRLESYAAEGVQALANATPKKTGKTAASWRSEVSVSDKEIRIDWMNDNINKGVPIAVILQYGHGTGTGGYVQGRDYINPAIQPIFDKIADAVWKEVTS